MNSTLVGAQGLNGLLASLKAPSAFFVQPLLVPNAGLGGIANALGWKMFGIPTTDYNCLFESWCMAVSAFIGKQATAQNVREATRTEVQKLVDGAGGSASHVHLEWLKHLSPGPNGENLFVNHEVLSLPLLHEVLGYRPLVVLSQHGAATYLQATVMLGPNLTYR